MLHSRRRAVPIGATLVLGLLFLLTPHTAGTPAGAQPAYHLMTPPSAGVLVNAGRFATPTGRSRVQTASAPVALRYDFDGGVDKPIEDTSGKHELRPLGQNGGTLRLVPSDGPGLAVAYPDRCTLPKERDCPRAILEGQRDDSLNPGRRPLRYGASVLMTHGDLADGANVVQKGYSVGGVSQFKLQVDHRQGHPSCVIAGNRARIYRAEPQIDVADGRWHDLECNRSSEKLTLLIDGTPCASVPVPSALSIANAEPLRIGGKGPGLGNDQFAGEIDNVFLDIGA
ncbi:LamG-like jellyroll fold domain-containing protein [Actinoplanes sp. HUAS TT8]|uniref:LamG-like jellyroll fold domain-containing protein n=1 Tax=Actinoplanes sp. HUAS TT8 TaxID=3447453 RepID=UPI003F5233B4